jgi:hypothetical protein
MTLNLVNLDAQTRTYMVEEIDLAIAAMGTDEGLYFSPRLNSNGTRDYPALIKEAAEKYNEVWLADQFRTHARLNAQEPRHLKNGRVIMADVAISAPETLADGEFNYFYIRALCRVAINRGIPNVEIYRAKQVITARSQSVAMIGTTMDARALLADLRAHSSLPNRIDLAFGLPPGPNSGLSVKLP